MIATTLDTIRGRINLRYLDAQAEIKWNEKEKSGKTSFHT